jgi:hypothetical protein
MLMRYHDPQCTHPATLCLLLAGCETDKALFERAKNPPMPEVAFEAFKALTRDRPDGRSSHPPMLENRYVSGSQTTKLTCQALADRISGKVEDKSDPHLGSNGNAIADVNLVCVPYGENEARVPVPGCDGWAYVIHPDGLIVQDWTGAILSPSNFNPPVARFNETCLALSHDEPFWLSVEEHKAPMFPYDSFSFDLADRQALAAAGAIHAMHDAGTRSLPPAHFLAPGDRRNRSMPLPAILLPGGINVIAAPYSEERTEKPRRYTRAEADTELARQLAKAAAAIKTATGLDPGAAAAWDAAHPEEFLWRRLEVVPVDRDEATREVAGLVLAHRVSAPVPDTRKAQRELARDRIKALVGKYGLPLALRFDNGTGYAINAKGALSTDGEPDGADRAQGEAVLAGLVEPSLGVVGGKVSGVVLVESKVEVAADHGVARHG